jgi:hypothetical protein
VCDELLLAPELIDPACVRCWSTGFDVCESRVVLPRCDRSKLSAQAYISVIDMYPGVMQFVHSINRW